MYITDPSGDPLSGGCVDLYDKTATNVLLTQCSGVDGEYNILIDIPTSGNTFRVLARDFPGYVNTWLGYFTTPLHSMYVTVHAGEQTSRTLHLDGTLTDGVIEVHVYKADGVTPATDGCVLIKQWGVDHTNTQKCNKSNGTYRFTGLRDSVYGIQSLGFADTVDVWYPAGAYYESGENALIIEGGATLSVDFNLISSLSIFGRVVDGGGQPLSGGDVELWTYVKDHQRWYWSPISTSTTGSDGKFSLDGSLCEAPDGASWLAEVCRVRFVGFGSATYAWYPNSSTWDGSTLIKPDSSPGYQDLGDVVIEDLGGDLYGQLAAPSTWGDASVCVGILEPNFDQAIEEQCGVQGSAFSFANIPAGDYQLCLYAQPVDGHTKCSGEYKPGIMYGGNVAYDFAVVAGSSTEVTLDFHQTITSSPTSSGSWPVTGGCMDVYDGAFGGELLGTDCTPEDGLFSVTLDTDVSDFDVSFRDFDFHLDSFYSGKQTKNSANRVDVPHGGTVNLVVELPALALVTGDITWPEASSATEACVMAYTLDSSGDIDFSVAAIETCIPSGETSYEFYATSGDYLLRFETDDEGVSREWFDGAPSIDDAVTVSLDEGETYVADAELVEAGQIAGDVTLSTSDPASDVCVYVHETDGDFVTVGCVDDLGHYTVGSLRPGDYLVEFRSAASGANEWYDDTAELGADTVTVAAGAATTVNAELDAREYLYGTVQLPSDATMNGYVYAFDASTDEYLTSVKPNGDGTFRLYTGAVEVYVLFDDFDGAAAEWYDDQLLPGKSEAVSGSLAGVSLGTISLSRGATIVGKYFSASGWGSGTCADVYTTNKKWVTTECGSYGEFSMDNLRPGTYKIFFYDDAGHGTMYRPAPKVGPYVTWSQSPTITVGAGDTVWLQQYLPQIYGFNSDEGATYVPGQWDEVHVESNNSFTGRGVVQFKKPGGSWSKVATVDVVDGFATLAVKPKSKGVYRVKLNGVTSETFAVSPITPDVFVTPPAVFEGVVGESIDVDVTIDALDHTITGDAQVQIKKPGRSWRTQAGNFPITDGEGTVSIAVSGGAQYRVVYGGGHSDPFAPTLVDVSSVDVSVPSSYVAGVPFDVDVTLEEPGNGTAKLEQRIDGGEWKTVKHGVKIVDGAGSRTITLNGGDTVEYRASYYGSDLSDVVSLTRDEITFDAAGGGDFFKGGAYDVDFTVTSDETFAGDVDLWVKKGSKKWTKAGKVTFVDGAGTATVKPSAKTTLYQLRAGPDRSAVVTFTKVNPTITLAFGDGDDGTHVVGDSFDLNVAIAGPDASTVPLYTGNVVLKIRKPGKSWKKVSGGVNIVDGVGTITLNQLKGKRDYQVVFGGKKSHIVRATGTSA